MEVYVISSGRADKQTTYNSLPARIQEKVKIAAPSAEAADYAEYPHVLVPVMGIGRTRQWLVDQCADQTICMLDDDLTFATRREDDPTKFYPSTEYEIEALFADIEFQLSNFAHVGVASREGGNRQVEEYRGTGRMLRVLSYDVEILRRTGTRYDNLEVMEDFDVTLSLLRKGYRNTIVNYMVQNQNGSNLKGGCSQYRTKDVQERAAAALASRHPGFVKLVQKNTKGADGWGTRTDVIIQWKRAYEESQ